VFVFGVWCLVFGVRVTCCCADLCVIVLRWGVLCGLHICWLVLWLCVVSCSCRGGVGSRAFVVGLCVGVCGVGLVCWFCSALCVFDAARDLIYFLVLG